MLITGAAGLIGSQIVKSLVDAGHEVIATDRVEINTSQSVTFTKGDLTSPEFIAQLDFACDAVIHLGSVPGPLHDTDANVLQNNVMGTYQVFAAAVAHNVPLVIYASSLSIYGTAWSGPWTSPEYAPFDENHPLHHYESYALSKEVNERSADMWANRSGTAFVGLRFPHTHNAEVFYEFRRKMQEGDPDTLKVGAKILWCYLDLRDAANGILEILNKGAKGSAAYNFAAPDTFAHKPTLEMLAEFHPKTEVVGHLPGFTSIFDCSAWIRDFGYTPQYLLDRG
ncbi:MAG: NAD-dependent epimerase/dehydratase family protein [Candidatus Planktophila sp.]